MIYHVCKCNKNERVSERDWCWVCFVFIASTLMREANTFCMVCSDRVAQLASQLFKNVSAYACLFVFILSVAWTKWLQWTHHPLAARTLRVATTAATIAGEGWGLTSMALVPMHMQGSGWETSPWWVKCCPMVDLIVYQYFDSSINTVVLSNSFSEFVIFSNLLLFMICAWYYVHFCFEFDEDRWRARRPVVPAALAQWPREGWFKLVATRIGFGQLSIHG